jgi:toxin HigB-1
MIESFKHKGLKRLHQKGDVTGIRRDMLDKIERILTVLDTAAGPDALDLPGYRLHSLKGEYKGFWSVTVNGNWRIIFRFAGHNAVDVQLIDYH